MYYNCQDHKIFNDGHLKHFAVAYAGWSACDNPEPFGVATLSPHTLYIH